MANSALIKIHIRRLFRTSFAICILLVCYNIHTLATDMQDISIMDISSEEDVSLSENIRYFPDCERQFSISELVKLDFETISNTVGLPSKLLDCNYYGYIKLRNKTAFQSWAIRASKNGLSHFKMALKLESQSEWKIFNSGLFETVKEQDGYFPVESYDNLIDILIPQEESVSMIFYFQNDRKFMSPELDLDLQVRNSAFYNNLHKWKFRTFLVTGLFLFLILLGLSLFLNTKDKAFLYYALYLISLLYWIYFSAGILNEWLVKTFCPDNPQLASVGFNVLICYVFYISFMWEFASLNKLIEGASKILRNWIMYILLFMPIVVFTLIYTNINFKIFFQIGVIYNVGMVLFTIYILKKLWLLKGHENVQYVFVGFLLMLILLVISAFEIVRNDFQVPKFSIIAFIFVIEILFFLWALAKRYKNYISLQTEHKVVAQNLEEKDVLLREIHHRVKNNLQVISALLTLQSSHLKDAQAKEALREGQDRVQSMALIHKDLYQHDNLKGVNTKEYLEQLVENLMSSYKVDTNEIEVKTEIQELLLDVDTMIPLGLTINELISNALKHAFHDGQYAKLSVKLKEDDNMLKLKIEDNGKGVGDIDVLKQKSFGYSLVQSFARKLDADLEIKSEQGLVISLDIRNYKKLA